MKIKFILFVYTVILFSSCNEDDENTTFPKEVSLTFDFQDDKQAWEGDFADYPIGEELFYELNFEYSNLPRPLNKNMGSLKQSGNNHSDDLFMFIRRNIKELEPNSNYKISYEIEFASNVADDQFGVGGSPGEGVTIKAGATTIKPEKIVSKTTGDYRMNIDKANQTNGGTDMVVLGDFSNDTNQNEYKLKKLKADEILIVSTDSKGELWLIVGTDSGFEATTSIYYNTIKVKLEKQ